MVDAVQALRAPDDVMMTVPEALGMTLSPGVLALPEGESFAAAVQELAEQYPDAQLTVAGPWPPYSFATLEQT